MFKNEEQLQTAVEAFFGKYKLPFVSQPILRSGNNPDIGLLTSGGDPFGCIEIKRGQRVASWDVRWTPDDHRSKWPSNPSDIGMAASPWKAASNNKRKSI